MSVIIRRRGYRHHSRNTSTMTGCIPVGSLKTRKDAAGETEKYGETGERLRSHLAKIFNLQKDR